MRKAEVKRDTSETEISVTFDPDGSGTVSSDTGIPFLDHMMNAMGKHGGFDLDIKAKGDLEIDCHHTMEDIGIVLGLAVRKSAGDKRGIKRFAHTAVPMDEAIAHVTLDFGGRFYLVMKGEFSGRDISAIPPDMFEHFFYSLCSNAGITAHIAFEGKNDHHICEAIFKAFGVALGDSVRIVEGRGIPSTKGLL